jgi:hypothetical protein
MKAERDFYSRMNLEGNIIFQQNEEEENQKN